ncbi:MAG TPA: hypothetical protein VIK05_04500 [Ilumatobacteraceae bacterium]
MAATPTAEQMAALLTQWNDWLSARTDTMLSLEDRVRTAGTDDDRADLAAAFVARKVVGDRLDEISKLAAHDRAGAAALANEPLLDTLGASVGANLADAAKLVDAIVDRVEAHVTTVERQSATDVESAARADADLTVAERLAQELGSHANRAAQLRSDLSARRDLPGLAGRAAALRGELEAVDAERRQLFTTWAALPDRLHTLGDVETSVRQLAERCRDKIVNAPALAIPSVAAVGELAAADDLRAMPWPAARAAMSPVVVKVQRLDAALTEARRRFQQPLDERDDLRGLLQSFRDKADAHGLGEDSDLEPMYRRAQSVLWAAPCDLGAARPLVNDYVGAVNAKITSTVSRGGAGS